MMISVILSTFLVAPAAVYLPAALQSGGDSPAQQSTECHLSSGKKKGSSLLGGLLGGLAEHVTGDSGLSAYIPFNTVATTLTDAIACRLDEDEQKKAANATNLAVSRGVGDTESWTSTTRDNVSGSSTVLAQNQAADGSTCVNVSDVIIVNGEETRATKRMCRAPGASGYKMVG